MTFASYTFRSAGKVLSKNRKVKTILQWSVVGLLAMRCLKNIVYSLFSDGPDAIYFAPNTTNYTLRSGDHIADIACIADCNPHCEYSWNKGYTKVGAQTLSLGIVERTAAGPYTCVASRGTASIRKSLTINVIGTFYIFIYFIYLSIYYTVVINAS